MLKKSMLFTAVLALVLLLTVAQLALAQQDVAPAPTLSTPQQGTGGTQSPGGGEGQSTAPDPSGQNDAIRTKPAEAGAKSTPPNNSSGLLMHLNRNNELVIDCPAVSSALLANPGLTQPEQVGLQELSQLCASGGFPPTTNTNGGSGGGSTQPNSNGPTGTTQPQQSQGTSTTPANDGGSNAANPSGTPPSNPPQRSAAVYP